MIDLDKTFSVENSEKIKVCLGEKFFLLKNGNIISNQNESICIYDIKNFQLINTMKFSQRILDMIQLKSEEILILVESKVLMYQLNTFKLLSTTAIQGKDYDYHYGGECTSSPERMFQLSDSTIAFVFNAAYDIDIYKKADDYSLNFVKKIKTKYSCYSACEINDNNIAYNQTENYKFGVYEVCFSHNDKVIGDLMISCERDSLHYYKEKNYLVVIGTYLYFIDLKKFEVVKKFMIGSVMIGGNYIDFKVYKNYIFVSVFHLFILDANNLELIKKIDFKFGHEDDWQPPTIKLLFLNNKIYLNCNGTKEGYYYVDFDSDKKEFREGSQFIRIYNINYK